MFKMDTEQKEAMDSWPEFPRAEQFMLPENGNRVYRAIITEEQYKQARAAIAVMRWRPIVLPMRQEPRYEYDTGTFMELYEHGNYLDVDEVKQAIEAAGYRWE